jgi:ribosomal protein S18 acetylase RimI-like enzyme
MFFAEEAKSEPPVPATPAAAAGASVVETSGTPPSSAASVQLIVSDNAGFLNVAGAFLVNSFWLGSDHHQLDGTIELAEDARLNLVIEQCADLQEKYGERMGKRLANACVLGALDQETKELVGLATLKETLLMNNELVESEKAEMIAKTAVASLGPKQRRQYKDAPLATIAAELLSPDTKAVCVLSNLCVSKKARRRGIAQTMCGEVEAISTDWGYSDVHLLVEYDNASARTLYEGKLGYKEVAIQKEAPALRVDMQSGQFVATVADTLILAKVI